MRRTVDVDDNGRAWVALTYEIGVQLANAHEHRNVSQVFNNL